MSAESTIQFHKASKQQLEVYTQDTIQSRIMTIRGHQVIMDADLAEFYQVKTIALNQAVKRNEIECSFGTGKRIYRANDIRAKLPDTARCWTGICYFVKNVMKFLRELCLVLTEIWRFVIYFVTMRSHIRYPLSVAGN